MKSKEIALSGIASAIAGVLVALAMLLKIFNFFFFVIASFALYLPFYKKFFVGGVLAYIVGALIALLFTGFNFVAIFPFVVWFGLHPIINEILEKVKVNIVIKELIKLVLFNIALFAIYKVTTLLFFSGDILSFLNGKYYLIAILFSALFLPYDYFFCRAKNQLYLLLDRIIKDK